MAKEWKIIEQTRESLKDFAHEHPVIAKMLARRGITTKDLAKDFLNPKYERLHSPFLFKDIEKAVLRIWQAIESGEKITIYGDYDADAVTANAVLCRMFEILKVKPESYIPDRFTEGYGVNLEALSKIKDEGSKVIITVDCGTNSIEAAKYCAENGIDFIITDHHEIIGQEPKAFALINPKNKNDNYPFSELTGVGVAFKLACAVLGDPKTKIQNPKYVEGYEKWLLDLVAIGTVADCHSLLDENRILVKFGLKVLAKTKWAGLKALMETSKINLSQRPLDTYILGFIIAPRLNAAGRLEHADIALDLLLEDNINKAREKALYLEEINSKRQGLTSQVLSEAREKALVFGDRKILALWADNWPKGVVGLAAGRLAEELNKPVIVLEKGETESTGSARSVQGFNIIESLKYASMHLVRFGGHSQAAGLTLLTSDFELFYKKVLQYAEENISTEKNPVLEIEAEITPGDLNLDFYNTLSAFEPFGVDNLKPKFLINGCEVASLRAVGADGKHLQMQLKTGAKIFGSIWFNSNGFAKDLKIGDTINIVCELIKDSWGGDEKVKLRIVDLRSSKHINI